MYFWLCLVFTNAHVLSLVTVSAGFSLIVVHGLLIVVASILPEHRLYTHGLEQLWCTGLVVPWPVVSSWTRDRAHVLHIDRWVLNHWTPGKSSAILLTMPGLLSPFSSNEWLPEVFVHTFTEFLLSLNFIKEHSLVM